MVRKTRLPESEVTRSNPLTGSSEKVFEINEKYIPLHQTGRFSYTTVCALAGAALAAYCFLYSILTLPFS